MKKIPEILISTTITIKQLREFLEQVPDKNTVGEDSEIWITTGRYTSSPCTRVAPLNRYVDEDSGAESCDVLLGFDQED